MTNAASSNGFTAVAPGDTAFLSRQELIKYAQTQNANLVAALPYLTTFSRELNGPTWGPSDAKRKHRRLRGQPVHRGRGQSAHPEPARAGGLPAQRLPAQQRDPGRDRRAASEVPLPAR
ncbi:MAG: hypothetical protein WDO13_21885 [Verrucomicrobiota bacterium]